MIIQEVYVGRTKGIDDLFNEFKKFSAVLYKHNV